MREEQNFRKVAISVNIFLTTPDEVEKYVQSNSSDNLVHHYNVEILNLFDPGLQLINTKIMIKNKFKKFLSQSNKFKVQKILALEYKKRNDRKISHSSAKLNASHSDSDEAFKFMYQSIMTKIKNYASEDCISWI